MWVVNGVNLVGSPDDRGACKRLVETDTLAVMQREPVENAGTHPLLKKTTIVKFRFYFFLKYINVIFKSGSIRAKCFLEFQPTRLISIYHTMVVTLPI